MRNKRSIINVVLLIAMEVSLGSPLANAQESGESLKDTLKSAQTNLQGDRRAAASRQRPPQNMGGATIISRVRRSEGVPFPAPEEVTIDPDTFKLDKYIAQDAERVSEPPPPYQRPKECGRDETKSEVHDATAEEGAALYDVIYLSEDFVPLDPEEVYGPGVLLRPYGANEEEAIFTRMRLDNVPCVPYRTRITAKATYRDYGMNALKNYTADPSGKGVLNVWVKQKLERR